MKHELWTKFDPTDLRPAPKWMKNPIPCPLCKGHTACIVEEDAYGPGRHFKCGCNQCGSMCPSGWVEAGSRDATCLHDFGNGVKLGNCYYRYTCKKCGATNDVDSSD